MHVDQIGLLIETGKEDGDMIRRPRIRSSHQSLVSLPVCPWYMSKNVFMTDECVCVCGDFRFLSWKHERQARLILRQDQQAAGMI